MDPVPLVAALGFLLLSGLFSAYETAYFALTPSELHALAQKAAPRPWAYWIRYFSENPQILLSSILIGNTLANLALTLLLLESARPLGTFGEALAGALSLALIVVFGEIFPKSLAINLPYTFLRLGTPLVQLTFWLVYPLSQGLDRIRSQVEKQWQPPTSPQKLAQLVDSLPGDISPPVEKRVLKNILLLRQLPVKAFMLSRVDMKAIPDHLTWQELKAALAEIPYIRIPVYRETPEEIVGILLLKDLLPHWDTPELTNWQALIRPALFVPETKNAYDLLLEMKNARQHVAIVVDEFGSISGLISLQRLLEVIFGYGEEEARSSEALYEVYPDGSICLKAQTPLVMVQEVLGMPAEFFTDEEARNAENLAEFLLSLAERIPQKGEILQYRDFVFEVLESTAHRIERVRAYRLPSEAPGYAETSRS